MKIIETTVYLVRRKKKKKARFISNYQQSISPDLIVLFASAEHDRSTASKLNLGWVEIPYHSLNQKGSAVSFRQRAQELNQLYEFDKAIPIELTPELIGPGGLHYTDCVKMAIRLFT